MPNDSINKLSDLKELVTSAKEDPQRTEGSSEPDANAYSYYDESNNPLFTKKYIDELLEKHNSEIELLEIQHIDDMHSIKTKAKDLQLEVDRLNKDISLSEKESKEAITRLEKELSILESIKDMDHSEKEYKETIARLENKLSKPDPLHDAHIEELRLEIRENEYEISILQEELEKAKNKTGISYLKETIHSLEEEIKELKLKERNNEDTIKTLQDNIILKDKEIETLSRIDTPIKHKIYNQNHVYNPLDNPRVISWLIQDVENYMQEDIDKVILLGEDPNTQQEMRSLLSLARIKVCKSGKNIPHIIVGKSPDSEQLIEECLSKSISENIYIYSQEMFISLLITGLNPFENCEHELLMKFAENHPVLQYLIKSGFEWPTILEKLADKPTHFGDDMSPESPMHALGYQVGRTEGKTKAERKRILRKTFTSKLPTVYSDEYMHEWGNPETRKRLWRMSHHIAWLIRTRRTNPTQKHAIEDWHHDLKWLKETYYKRWMRFEWPETNMEL